MKTNVLIALCVMAFVALAVAIATGRCLLCLFG